MPRENQNYSGPIQSMITDSINQLKKSILCTVTRVYEDNHVDIKIPGNDGKLNYVRIFGKCKKDDEALLIFGEKDTPYVIADMGDIITKFGLNQPAANKFNYAIITKNTTNITYEELWILSNAYYDYNAARFVKIDPTHTSFGIQIQANGTYPGEAELGYSDNVGINIWRNPKTSDVYKDTSVYDYTDFDEKGYLGAKRLSDNVWVEFAISSGWNNSFMIDSYGGMTIGGSGFEIDGNGLLPFTRLTHSTATINGDSYVLLGLLDNAYHNANGCDTNNTWSWFIGLRIPYSSYTKDNKNASFVVMYNDTEYNSSDIHELNSSDWHVVFEVDKNGIVE